ncbi:MAG: isoprenylcysteine carboxylmethyltransferase family protein [Bdellovibrionaceae bacterium]|nr:isoprenylcysteine carboxylmethyltransferase family protein [Pseudobdellovibrionaceae bacterium]
MTIDLSIIHLLVVLLFLCYLSFWYSSLKIFKTTKELNRKHRIFFKLLTIGLWNYSLITLAFMSPDLWGQTRINLQLKEIFLISFMLLISLSLFWYAKRTIENVKFDVIFSKKTPEVIVMEGPYRLIRHPFYTSYIVTYLGLILLNYNFLVSLVAGVLVVDYVFAALNEEKKFLTSSFSKEYKSYQSKTKMFFPFIF